ncbi:hypothetical protein diail_7429 [Diaporthe ilicicola]|nr:hypothetical protein diail_7429 [Diaporthe ilicicola]
MDNGFVLGDKNLLPYPKPVKPASVEQNDYSKPLVLIHREVRVGISYAMIVYRYLSMLLLLESRAF